MEKMFRCMTKNFPRVEKILWLFSVTKSAIVMLGSMILVACWYPDQPFSIVGKQVRNILLSGEPFWC